MNLPSSVREQVGLAGFTTFRIGGPARWLAEPGNRDELAEALAFAGRLGVGPLILGGGSNLLVADAGVETLVIRLGPDSEFARVRRDMADPAGWRVGAAAGLPGLVGETGRAGADGLAVLAGIPGTVGGAARMNAGGADGAIGQHIVSARVMDMDGNETSLPAAELGFVYRDSRLAGRIALDFTLRLPPNGEPAEIARRIGEYRARKARSQPLDLPSAGCVFKNPSGDSAGRLLDAAGCKGWRRGGAEVSQRHANFIVNRGGASAAEVVELIRTMRDAVEQRFGVVLEPEVRIWSQTGEHHGIA